eukprot:2802859-Pyramimonas_sp.AAC.2
MSPLAAWRLEAASSMASYSATLAFCSTSSCPSSFRASVSALFAASSWPVTSASSPFGPASFTDPPASHQTEVGKYVGWKQNARIIRSVVWGVECILAVIGTGGPVT